MILYVPLDNVKFNSNLKIGDTIQLVYSLPPAHVPKKMRTTVLIVVRKFWDSTFENFFS
jgi:hypothetical protein